MTSEAKTVQEYLESLPEDRRDAISQVREVILKNLPTGYEEVMNWGMISYQVPLDRYPVTYNQQPLMYAALASQKNHMAVYLSNIYSNEDEKEWFEEEYRKSGKKMDKGKSCVRFKDINNLPLELIGKAIGKTSVDEYIKMYEDSRK